MIKKRLLLFLVSVAALVIAVVIFASVLENGSSTRPVDPVPAPSGSRNTDSGVDYDSVERVSGDYDGDGLKDVDDNCPEAANPQQEDIDRDAIGDACDANPSSPEL